MSTSYELDTFQRAPSSKHSISSISSLSLPSTPLPAIINHSHTTLSLELDHNPPSTSSSFPEPEASEEIPFIPALPPVDSGHEAWLFLISATLIETLVWGLPFSVGILNVYWTQTLFKGYGGSTVALAATLQTGLMYMSTGLLGPLLAAFPRYTKRAQIVGLVVASSSMIGSAFVTKPWHLVLTIGCFYPFAGALYLPCATLLFEWFYLRRGLASGIMYSGTGVGGAIFPFLVSGLLSRFGYKAMMVSLGIGFALINGTALIFIKRRVPLALKISGDRSVSGAVGVGGGEGGESESVRRLRRTRTSKIDWSFAKRRAFYTGSLVILVTGLGNFVPSLWLPSYASDLKAGNPSGTGLIALMNAASVPGATLTGYLSDRLPLRTVIFLSSAGAAASCLLLWGFSTNDGLLVAFALSFGLTGLSFVALWSRMISIISKDDPNAPALVFAVFAFIRGIGNITSGPISEALLKVDVLRGSIGGYGLKNYGVLLIYTVVTIFTGGATGLIFTDK